MANKKETKKVFEEKKAKKRELFNEQFRKFIYHSNMIAYSLGELTASEQHFFDYITSKIQQEDSSSKKYTVTVNEMIRYYGTRNGYTYQKIQTDLDNLVKAHFDIYHSEDKKTEFIPIFKKLELSPDKHIITYIFNPESRLYLFRLHGKFYLIDLATLRAVQSKSALILLRMWTAEKNLKTTVNIDCDIDTWRVALQGQKEKGKRMPARRIVQTIQRAVDSLKDLFSYRYHFDVKTSYAGHKISSCKVSIFGDNSTTYPILNNEKTDKKDGSDIRFYNESNTTEELIKDFDDVKKYWGIDLSDKKYPNVEINNVKSPSSKRIDKEVKSFSGNLNGDNIKIDSEDLPF